MDAHAHAIMPLCLSCLPFLCTVHVFIHQHYIFASDLGTLEVQRIDVKLLMMEPNHKIVFGGRILKRGPAGAAEDPAKVGRAQGLVSSNTDLVLPQESPRA